MRPAVATVMSARPWEAAFVVEATTSALVRVVARIDGAWELAELAMRLDVLLIGAETPWLEPWMFDTVHRLGCATIGLHLDGDEVGASMVSSSTLRLVDTTPPQRLVRSATAVAQSGLTASKAERSTSDPQTHRYSRAPGSTGRYR
jgi:hypothetical protein